MLKIARKLQFAFIVEKRYKKYIFFENEENKL